MPPFPVDPGTHILLSPPQSRVPLASGPALQDPAHDRARALSLDVGSNRFASLDAYTLNTTSHSPVLQRVVEPDDTVVYILPGGKTLRLGTKFNPAALVPVRAVRADSGCSTTPESADKTPARRSWIPPSLRVHRRNRQSHDAEDKTPLIPASAVDRGRTGILQLGRGIENRPSTTKRKEIPPAWGIAQRTLTPHDEILDEDVYDERTPEEREAMHVNAAMRRAGFVYELVDALRE
ncbi:hypothetical protein C8F01DRAFT_1094439 [Mycena amicta]|nr:hypothetical protein C8F01DRAFT_1094439 [Mycena amicta]